MEENEGNVIIDTIVDTIDEMYDDLGIKRKDVDDEERNVYINVVLNSITEICREYSTIFVDQIYEEIFKFGINYNKEFVSRPDVIAKNAYLKGKIEAMQDIMGFMVLDSELSQNYQKVTESLLENLKKKNNENMEQWEF